MLEAGARTVAGPDRAQGRRPPARPPRPEPLPGAQRDGLPAAAATAGAKDALAAPEPPAANRAGNYSLARQLGLAARRIVIDAGHGGHDPGTIGRRGLQEKDLVLDVALRLEKMVRAGAAAPRWS